MISGMQSTRPQTDNIFLSDYVAWNYTLLSNVFSGPIGRISAANSTGIWCETHKWKHQLV